LEKELSCLRTEREKGKNDNDNLDPQKPRKLTLRAEILCLSCVIVPREFSRVGNNGHPAVLVWSQWEFSLSKNYRIGPGTSRTDSCTDFPALPKPIRH